MSDFAIEASLGELLLPPGPEAATPITRRQAVVTAVATDSVSINLGGTVIPGVKHLSSYAPIVGEVVWVFMDGSDPLVVGRVGVDADKWHVVGAAGEPAFENGWTNFLNGWPVAAFRRVRDRTEYRGLIAAGTMGTTAFTVPVAYRPDKGVHRLTMAGDLACGLRFHASGAVQIGPPSPSAAWVTLECTVGLTNA